MTFQQLRLAVEVGARGSVSAAARQLFISQPNASQALKKLEDELGYEIFRRVANSAVPTEQGYRFLLHAENILREDMALRALSEENDVPRLRVGIMNYSPAAEAFARFCGEYPDAIRGELSAVNISPDRGLVLLKNQTLDIVVALMMKAAVDTAEKECKANKLELRTWKSLPVCVRVRKDHPLVVSGELDGTPEGFRALSRYPYVEYRDLESLSGGPLALTSSSPYGYSYKIYTDERESRFRIASASNAYIAGAWVPQAKLDPYGLINILTGDGEASLTTVTRKGDHDLPSIKRFTELLKEQVEINA